MLQVAETIQGNVVKCHKHPPSWNMLPYIAYICIAMLHDLITIHCNGVIVCDYPV